MLVIFNLLTYNYTTFMPDQNKYPTHVYPQTNHPKSPIRIGTYTPKNNRLKAVIINVEMTVHVPLAYKQCASEKHMNGVIYQVFGDSASGFSKNELDYKSLKSRM